MRRHCRLMHSHRNFVPSFHYPLSTSLSENWINILWEYFNKKSKTATKKCQENFGRQKKTTDGTKAATWKQTGKLLSIFLFWITFFYEIKSNKIHFFDDIKASRRRRPKRNSKRPNRQQHYDSHESCNIQNGIHLFCDTFFITWTRDHTGVWRTRRENKIQKFDTTPSRKQAHHRPLRRKPRLSWSCKKLDNFLAKMKSKRTFLIRQWITRMQTVDKGWRAKKSDGKQRKSDRSKSRSWHGKQRKTTTKT